MEGEERRNVFKDVYLYAERLIQKFMRILDIARTKGLCLERVTLKNSLRFAGDKALTAWPSTQRLLPSSGGQTNSDLLRIHDTSIFCHGGFR